MRTAEFKDPESLIHKLDPTVLDLVPLATEVRGYDYLSQLFSME